MAMVITETEAYLGKDDKASHARFGFTERNRVMYGNSGVWYVYLVYGMHWMLNVVAHLPNRAGLPRHKQAGAVLIRSGILLDDEKNCIITGPGRVTRVFGVNKLTNKTRISPKEMMWIEDRGIRVGSIKKGPRVGVGYAGSWASRHLRFMATKKNIDVIIDTVDNFA